MQIVTVSSKKRVVASQMDQMGQRGSGTELPETFYRDHRCEMPVKGKDQGPVPPWAARETVNNHGSLPFGSAL